MEKHLKELLAYLMTKECVTAEEIGDYFKISEKTARNRIKYLKEEIRHSDCAELISKPRYGYNLEIKNQQGIQELLAEEESMPTTVEERNHFLIAYLLQRHEYVKMEEIADFLYISKNTLGQSLKVVENIFEQYGIHIHRKPNYGIKVCGKELDIRHLQMDYFIKRNALQQYNSKKQEDIERLSALVWGLLEKYELHLSEIAYENLIDYIYISVKRMEKGFTVEEDTVGNQEVGIKEKIFIKELVAELEKYYELSIPETERKFLLLYVAGRRVTEILGGIDSNFIIKEHTDLLAMKMIEQVQELYNFRFFHVFDLRMALNQHLVPFDIRIKYSIPTKNPLLEEIKKEYSLAYEMAYRAVSLVLHPYYKKNICDDEIGYFALIFALALEKEKSNIGESAHSNILVVCASGYSSSRLLEYKYKNVFHQYIKNVYVCDLLGLSKFDFSKVDYVFTTIPLSQKIPVPIFEVSLFLTDDEIKMVGGILKNKGHGKIEKYYRSSRFIPCLQAKDKWEAIAFLCDLIACQEEVDSDFHDLVLERESFAQMDYGNEIAIPHPNCLASEETFAYVAVLKTPILWNKQKVQVILLTSVGREVDENRQFFYEITARFALNSGKIKRLIAEPSFMHLLELLEE